MLFFCALSIRAEATREADDMRIVQLKELDEMRARATADAEQERSLAMAEAEDLRASAKRESSMMMHDVRYGYVIRTRQLYSLGCLGRDAEHHRKPRFCWR